MQYLQYQCLSFFDYCRKLSDSSTISDTIMGDCQVFRCNTLQAHTKCSWTLKYLVAFTGSEVRNIYIYTYFVQQTLSIWKLYWEQRNIERKTILDLLFCHISHYNCCSVQMPSVLCSSLAGGITNPQGQTSLRKGAKSGHQAPRVPATLALPYRATSVSHSLAQAKSLAHRWHCNAETMTTIRYSQDHSFLR